MTEGWIALHRKIYNSKDFNNQLEVAVFLYLVSMASHKNCEVIYRKKRIKLKRGEVSTSTGYIFGMNGATCYPTDSLDGDIS